ncbi:hypothetical protein ACWGOQ_0003895 [Aquimarina sp. M1]
MDANQLFEKIEKSNPIDFGNIFNKSIELFKKVWLQGFIHLLISMVIIVPLIFVMYIPIIALASIGGFESDYGGQVYYQDEISVGMIVLFVILVIVVSLVGSAFQLGITAHFYRVCKQVDLQLPEATNYLMFFKGKYLGKIFTLAIATFGIALLATLLCYLPIFYVMVPLQLLGVIFAFNPDVSTSDLIKSSFKFGNKIWLIAFGLIIISSILAQFVGMILCFVGVFFTASFVYLPIYYMYKDGIGFHDDNKPESWNAIVEQ